MSPGGDVSRSKAWFKEMGFTDLQPLYLHPSADRDDAELVAVKAKIDARLNDYLCEMREGFDDSIVGFNEAWDIVRAVFTEAIDAARRSEGEKE